MPGCDFQRFVLVQIYSR